MSARPIRKSLFYQDQRKISQGGNLIRRDPRKWEDAL